MVCACVKCREELLPRRALIERLSSGINRRQAVRARDANLRPGFQNSRCRDANVVVLLEGSVDQVLKLLVLKHFPPFLFPQRFRLLLLCLFRFTPPVPPSTSPPRPL